MPPDILLGADCLCAPPVLLAMNQRRMYYSVVGGEVFGSDYNSAVPGRATALQVVRVPRQMTWRETIRQKLVSCYFLRQI
jgi:hypothetical protein